MGRKETDERIDTFKSNLNELISDITKATKPDQTDVQKIGNGINIFLDLLKTAVDLTDEEEEY